MSTRITQAVATALVGATAVLCPAMLPHPVDAALPRHLIRCTNETVLPMPAPAWEVAECEGRA